MHSARQFIFGLALCFLAALLAVEAKTAWAAGRSPSDISAVKLCPVAGKQMDAARAPSISSGDGVERTDHSSILVEAGLGKKKSAPCTTAADAPPLSKTSFFSPSLFFRPPPSL